MLITTHCLEVDLLEPKLTPWNFHHSSHHSLVYYSTTHPGNLVSSSFTSRLGVVIRTRRKVTYQSVLVVSSLYGADFLAPSIQGANF